MTAVLEIPGAAERRARAFAAADHAAGAETLLVLNPATEEPLAAVAAATAADVDVAVAAASAAFRDGRWSWLDPVEQERVLGRLADAVAASAEELAWLETLDNGKPLAQARADVAGAARVLRYYAGWPTKLAGDVHSTDRRFLALSVGEPVGVCGQIIPWNYPLLMASWKVGPALAAGCTIVLKPAEQTPLTALRLAELALEAGVPEAVLNVVTGDGRAGAALAAHPDVRKIAFTGSTDVGRSVMRAAADSVKRVTLELGGKNPNIVFADADLQAALTGALEGAFENMGQACIAGSRLLVERSVHDEFIDALAERAAGLRVGPGWDDRTQIGPLVSAQQRAHVSRHLELAHEQGARIATGPWTHDGRGFFVAPTVVAEVSPQMRIFRDEVFGPVVAVTSFDTEEEALELANDTSYGLSAGVWTRDVGRALRFGRGLKAGTVWLNAYGSIRPEVPFGGFGQSGVGRELGAHALDAYRETKSIFLAS
jgi:phenylacetaldehyde dehydrogenase